MNILETKRLVLRQITLGDAPFILLLLNDPSFINNIGDRGVRTLADAAKYIQDKFITSYERNGYGLYLAILKETKAPVGISGLVKRDSLPDADIGFASMPEYFGLGLTYESARAVLKYAKDTLKLKRVLGITSPHNIGSIKVLEKIGLRYEDLVELVPGDKVKLFSIDF